MKRWKPLDKCREFAITTVAENKAPSKGEQPQKPNTIPKQNTPVQSNKDIKKALQQLHEQQYDLPKEEEIPMDIDSTGLAQQTLKDASSRYAIKKVLNETTKEEPDEPSVPLPDESAGESHIIRLGLGIAMIFFVTLLLLPKNLFKKTAITPLSLAPKDRRHLEQIAKIQSDKKTLFRMAINKKRDHLWLAGNYKGEGKVFLTLRSNPEKTLSLKKILITSESRFRKGYARFTRFTLVKGNWPVSGEYQATIHLYPENPKESSITWKGLFVLPPKGELSLSESLKHWKKTIHSRLLSPLRRQHQYYQTLKSQLISMKDFYEKSFRANTWSEFSTLFEQRYNRDIGPLLQRFILDGRRLHLSLFNSDVENSKEYEKIFLYGKKIGVLASDMVTVIGQGDIKESEKGRIGKNLLSKLDRLTEQADSALNELQKKISDHQKELPEH